MFEVSPLFEGAAIAVFVRLLLGFQVNLVTTAFTGVASFLAIVWFGPGVPTPDWWAVELVIGSAVTVAILGIVHTLRTSYC